MEELRAAEVARLLGVSVKTVARYCVSGVLRAKRERRGVLGRYRWMIERTSVNELVEQQRKHNETQHPNLD